MAKDNKKSAKEMYHEGFAQRHPEIDMNDEEAYYGALNEGADRLAKYQANEENFNKAIGNSPLFTDAILASRDNPEFDPILWAIENNRLDLDALQSDPKYKEKLAAANKKALEMRAKDKEIADKFEQNIGNSLEKIKAKANELGLDEESAKNAYEKYYKACFDATEGIFYPEIFELIAKGEKYDNDVAEAKEEGKVEGMQKKVNDKLRKIPAAREGNAGGQAPKAEKQPVSTNTDNMFGLY